MRIGECQTLNTFSSFNYLGILMNSIPISAQDPYFIVSNIFQRKKNASEIRNQNVKRYWKENPMANNACQKNKFYDDVSSSAPLNGPFSLPVGKALLIRAKKKPASSTFSQQKTAQIIGCVQFNPNVSWHVCGCICPRTYCLIVGTSRRLCAV